MGNPVLPLTARLSENQETAHQQAMAMQNSENNKGTRLTTQASIETDEVVWIYNLLEKSYIVEQPPLFPRMIVPARKPGEKFGITRIPRYVNEVFTKPGTDEKYYSRRDGRECASSLLNPAMFPGRRFEAQLQNWSSQDQQGNNLNAFGVWWSLTPPNDPKIEEEAKLFKNRVDMTMRELIKRAEELAASNEQKMITPWMHFAMDYFNMSAPWHMASFHMIPCPNCGEAVREGIAYHRNSFGDRCIIDHERYEQSLARAARPAPEEDEQDSAAPKRKVRKEKPAA